MAKIGSAFKSMAQAKHIGKLALRVSGEKVEAERARYGGVDLRSNATYLITGGLGGLGLSSARWLVENGAEHLVLLGRSNGSSEAEEAVEAMRKFADVVVERADVAKPQELKEVLSRVRRDMPPLGGVVHAAGLLDDGILVQTDISRFDTVLRPKIVGAWALHSLTLNEPLDFFVLFSSVASVLGSAGQGNYCAANAYLDCLAHYRRSKGLPAMTINWGPWSDVGLAARADRRRRLGEIGLDCITPGEGVAVFGHLMKSSAAQVSVMQLDVSRWHSQTGAGGPFLDELRAGQDANREVGKSRRARLTLEALIEAQAGQREKLAEDYLGSLIGKVLGFGEDEPVRIDPGHAIGLLGVDSLMAVEMKSRVEADLGITIPVADFIKGGTLAKLSAKILEQLPGAAPGTISLITGQEFPLAGAQWEELSI